MKRGMNNWMMAMMPNERKIRLSPHQSLNQHNFVTREESFIIRRWHLGSLACKLVFWSMIFYCIMSKDRCLDSFDLLKERDLRGSLMELNTQFHGDGFGWRKYSIFQEWIRFAEKRDFRGSLMELNNYFHRNDVGWIKHSGFLNCLLRKNKYLMKVWDFDWVRV